MLLMLPACVVRLADRNSPKVNGAVTGTPANCAAMTNVLPHGSPQGDATPKLVGRYAYPQDTPGGALFDWSGNYITVRFQGTSHVTAKLRLPDRIPQDQLFTFIVDDRPPEKRLITVTKDAAGKPTLEPEENYDVGGLDPNTAHELTIYKDTEAQKGSVLFKGFELNGGTLLPPTRRPRRIEFIGDSIVCGYGDEGQNATCPFEVKLRDVTAPEPDGKLRTYPVTVPMTENQYLAFTAIAARELDAEAVTTCWSGKGAYLNYKELFKTDPNNPSVFLYKSDDHSSGNRVPEDDAKTTVPQFWETRTLATDYQGNQWDFTQEKPDEIPQVVFISLGTNDFSRDTKEPAPDPSHQEGDNIPDGDMINPAQRETFFQSVWDLVKNVRQHRPDAHIFLATPPMVTDQYPIDNARTYIRDILRRVANEQARVGDPKVYQLDLVEQGFRYGLGCDYHPNLEVHRIMAEQVAGAIRSKTCW